MDVTEIFGIQKEERDDIDELILPYDHRKRPARSSKDRPKSQVKRVKEVVVKPVLPNPKVSYIKSAHYAPSAIRNNIPYSPQIYREYGLIWNVVHICPKPELKF